MRFPFPKYDEGGAYHWDECDRRSPRYNPGLVARYEAVVKRVPLGMRVLDIGCGDGYLMYLLTPLADEVIGIDPEVRAVELAREKLSGHGTCRLCAGTAYDLCFPDRSFDVVVLADVIEHLEHPARALSEAARALRDTGVLIVTTPRMSDRPISKYHVTEYPVAELRDLLRGYFRQVAITGVWPMGWIRFWRTRIGFRVFPRIARWLGNPLLREGEVGDRFAMIVASCTSPCSRKV